MRAEFKAARAELAAHLDKQATRFSAAVRFQASASTVQPQTIQKSLPARLHARLSLPARTPARLPVSAASVPAAATPGTGLHWIACTHLHPRCLTLPPSAHALCCACRAWQSCLPAMVRRMRSTRKRLSNMQPARCVNACSAVCPCSADWAAVPSSLWETGWVGGWVGGRGGRGAGAGWPAGLLDMLRGKGGTQLPHGGA